MSKVFIDTNILVYCADNNNPEKQNTCRNLIRQIVKKQIGVISTQVLQEYFVTVTKKLHIEPLIAKEMLRSFENFEVVTVTSEIIKEAIDCSAINTISFWDSLIVCSADYSKCSKLITEDMNHGQIIRGVEIFNPLL